MDQRIYFHQYRRPRVSNPTYLSSNVQNSISFFNGGYKSDSHGKRESNKVSNMDQNYQSNVSSQFYQQNIPHNENKYLEKQRTIEPIQNNLRPQNSKLSNYGERSLTMDQRSVYNKQSSKFDIINLKPLDHSIAIKQYPWLTIENRDDVYYRRMNEQYNGDQRSRTKTYDSNNLRYG